ncbi:sensor histidine kinase [Micromonospora sp. CPCC 205539]|uniref:sensor histidine kinase n=1 Tax=Micromonospora sp. CPCC 205539 TaxID=3122408 RepID=UPI002FF0F2CC
MRAADVLLALGSAAAITVATAVAVEPGSGSSTVAAYALGLVMGCLLLFRRRRPVTVLVLSLIAVMGYNLTELPSIPPIWPLLLPLYTVARAGQATIGAAVGGSTLLVSAGWVLHAGVPPLELFDGVLREAALLALALVAGTAVRHRELLAQEFTARVAAQRQQQERESAQQVLEERLRIARELHDVTAHTVAVVGIQISLARELVEDDPAATRDLLGTAHRVNVDAIGELETAVRLLRGPADATAADRHPVPDETQIEALLDRATDGGLRVTFHREGAARPLPRATGLTLYRIAQESVTNVLRHAGAAAVTVTLRYGDEDVRLDIVDDGGGADHRADADRPPGHGLTGMGERATSVGGTLTAGPQPSGGFAVRARLPLPSRAAAPTEHPREARIR